MCMHDLLTIILTPVPGPASVALSSITSNPIQPGSDVILICNVSLNGGPEIDIPLTVNIELSKSDPVGSPLTTTPLSMSGLLYSTTTMVSSFGRNQSGVYTCMSTVNSTSPNVYLSVNHTAHSVRVTTGKK